MSEEKRWTDAVASIDLGPSTPDSPKTLNEIRYGMKTNGPVVKLAQVEGAPLIILAASFFKTDFAAGACVQFSQKAAPGWFVTFSETVISILEAMTDNFPFIATPTSHKSASDRTYWTLE